MTPTTARSLAEQYRLPVATTAEIVGEATRQALLRSGWCWTLLVIGLGGAAGLAYALGDSAQGDHHGLNVFALIMAIQVVMLAWRLLGQRLARRAIHAEAARIAARAHPEPDA